MIVASPRRPPPQALQPPRALRALLALCAALLVALVALLAPLPAQAQLDPGHGRPYFLPEGERARIKALVAREAWAQAAFRQLEEQHAAGDGYASAFLYALERDQAYLAPARAWLLDYGRKGGDLGQRALEADDAFFRGGQPWLGDVYYRTDLRPLVAYDWVYRALSAEERATVEAGILASARFRMRAMDRWSQTPNLVFKPTVMVAAAGLATGDPELLMWGFLRKPWSTRGGYLPVLNLMIREGGPWGEAPIYPIAHENLSLMAQMSRLLALRDGRDWFDRVLPGGGGSPKELMDYYIDTAYPLERTGRGPGQIRVATYGNGATSAAGDLFLVNPAGPGLDLHRELAEAYSVDRDPRYAAFLAMVADYRANLIDRPPLAADAAFPPAPSRVWPHYGLAMLRSEESPAYWTSERAIAVFQIMSQGYGHEHRDKFAIMLHGAGRLLYPDYNAVQYENPAIGWTQNSVAHNTVVVDGQDTRSAAPSDIRADFRPGVKFLATSASEVFEGVAQTRALLLTHDYLLDVFHLTSAVPHTYDYLLHSLGRPVADRAERYAPTAALEKRYWRLEAPRGARRDGPWTLDFVLDGDLLRRKDEHDVAWLAEKSRDKSVDKARAKFRFGPQWYDHTAAVRVAMAGDPGTLVVHGRAPHGLGMLAARRAGRRDTAFVATHEPYGGPPGAEDRPEIAGVSVLARSAGALVARIEARDYTDYAAVALGPQKDEAQDEAQVETQGEGAREHVLVAADDPQTRFAFRSYGYLRVGRDGRAAAWGDWNGFRVPHRAAALEVNGRAAEVVSDRGSLAFGRIPATADPPRAEAPDSPLEVALAPTPVRLFERDRRALTVTVTNTLEREISGRVAFEAPAGLRIEPAAPRFGPLAPGASEALEVTVSAAAAAPGRHAVLYRLVHPPSPGAAPAPSGARAFDVMVGPVLEKVYRHPEPAIYLVHAPKFTAAFEMFHGLARYLADDDGTVRLDGAPLFTLSDGARDLLAPTTDHAFTWPRESPAAILANLYDEARYGIDFVGDRMVVRMDPDWTRAEAIRFTVPGGWRSPQGPPAWTAVTAAKTAAAAGAEAAAAPIAGRYRSVSGAELAFPGSDRGLCFQFLPPQDVDFAAAGMAFTVNGYAGDRWAVGFCPRGGLKAWQWQE